MNISSYFTICGISFIVLIVFIFIRRYKKLKLENKNNKIKDKKEKLDNKILDNLKKTKQDKEKIKNETKKLKNKQFNNNISAADNLNSLPK